MQEHFSWKLGANIYIVAFLVKFLISFFHENCFFSKLPTLCIKKWRENSADFYHQTDSFFLAACVDCARSLIIVYHFTAIVKLLQECIFWYFGGLQTAAPWIQLQILLGISVACGPSTTTGCLANHSNTPMWFLPLVPSLLVFPSHLVTFGRNLLVFQIHIPSPLSFLHSWLCCKYPPTLRGRKML